MNTSGPEGSAAISAHNRPQLPGQVDVVVVLLRLAGIVEQDDAAEAVTAGELLQPRRDGLAEEAEDEEFADVVHLAALLRQGTAACARSRSAKTLKREATKPYQRVRVSTIFFVERADRRALNRGHRVRAGNVEVACRQSAQFSLEGSPALSVTGASGATFAGPPRSVQSGGSPILWPIMPVSPGARPNASQTASFGAPPRAAFRLPMDGGAETFRRTLGSNKQFAEIVSEGASEIIGISVARYARSAGEGIRSARPDHGSLLVAAPITGLKLCGQAPQVRSEAAAQGWARREQR